MRLCFWSPPATPAGLRRPPPWRRQSRRRPLSRALILMVALFLAGACSAPVDSGPKSIRSASIPVGLRTESSSTTTTTFPPGASEVVTAYYITLEGRLQAVERSVSLPVTPQKVLQTLFAGPNAAEAATLHTAISRDTNILSADVQASILTVNTSKSFAFGPVPEQISAYAQVVFTALDLPGVIGVRFAQNGKVISVQAGDGSSNTAPLGRASYSQLTPR